MKMENDASICGTSEACGLSAIDALITWEHIAHPTTPLDSFLKQKVECGHHLQVEEDSATLLKILAHISVDEMESPPGGSLISCPLCGLRS
jgi:hypothetical protein